jgi:hypothetical protein
MIPGKRDLKSRFKQELTNFQIKGVSLKTPFFYDLFISVSPEIKYRYLPGWGTGGAHPAWVTADNNLLISTLQDISLVPARDRWGRCN